MDLLGIAAVLKALAWPVVVLAIAFKFSAAISSLLQGAFADFLKRATEWKVGPTGSTLSASPPQQIPVEVPSLEKSSDEVPADEPGASPPPETVMAASAAKAETPSELAPMLSLPEPSDVYDALETGFLASLEARHPRDLEAQLAWGARFYAVAAVQHRHEELYRIIYGSQLELLIIAELMGFPVPMSVAREIFDKAVAKWPLVHNRDKFNIWIEWLLGTGLVTLRPASAIALLTEDTTQSIELTALGSNFLSYITARRLPTDKPF